MIDKKILLQTFTQNFVQRERRERARSLLNNPKKRSKFTDMLNHRWEDVFQMRYLTELEKEQRTYENVKLFLNLTSRDNCYVISDGQHDDKLLDFNYAFRVAEEACFATVVLSISADRLYFKSELIDGNARHYFGKTP